MYKEKNMSRKKPYISNAEYNKAFARLARFRAELNERFVKVMKANASMSEYAEIFLKYFNQFRSDAEKEVALMHIFFLGLNVRKVADDAEEKEKEVEKRIEDIEEKIKKGGKMPTN